MSHSCISAKVIIDNETKIHQKYHNCKKTDCFVNLVMGEIHDQLGQRGREYVLASDIDRCVVDVATDYLSTDEGGGIGFVDSGWAQASFFQRRIPNDQSWQVCTNYRKFIVQPSRSLQKDRSLKWVGVPYGSLTCFMMLYFQNEALRTEFCEIELGRTLRDWLRRMEISPWEKSIADVRKQVKDIAECLLDIGGQFSSLEYLRLYGILLIFFDPTTTYKLVQFARSFLDRRRTCGPFW